jgi:hypothetical protein
VVRREAPRCVDVVRAMCRGFLREKACVQTPLSDVAYMIAPCVKNSRP